MAEEIYSTYWKLEVREGRHGSWYFVGGEHPSLEAVTRYRDNFDFSRDKRRVIAYRIWRYELHRMEEAYASWTA